MAEVPRPGDFMFYTVRRTAQDWETTWYGRNSVLKAIIASKLAIDKLDLMMAEEARENHPWTNRTWQTFEATVPRPGEEPPSMYSTDAEIDWTRRTVSGAWGVRELPRWDKEEDKHPVTTKDVAMFLEFGTVNNPGGYPWLYPAYDSLKGLLPAMVEAEYRTLNQSTIARFQPRVAGHFIKTGLGERYIY